MDINLSVLNYIAFVTVESTVMTQCCNICSAFKVLSFYFVIQMFLLEHTFQRILCALYTHCRKALNSFQSNELLKLIFLAKMVLFPFLINS